MCSWSPGIRAFVTIAVCGLAPGCSPLSPSGVIPVGESTPVTRVEVVSVERWVTGGMQAEEVPWDTVRLVVPQADLTPAEAERRLPPQFWLGLPPALPDPPRTGTSWTDTIRIWQGDGLNRRSLGLNRENRIIGDTILAGRRILIVEERSGLGAPWVLHFELRSEETEVPGAYVRHERGVYQELRARSWLDPSTGNYEARWDTLRTGPEALSLHRQISPDGDTVSVPTRFDATRAFRVIRPPQPVGG